jgi:hypothetical protein
MKIDVTKPKYFQFNVNIDGIDYHTLKGKLEFFYEGVLYGFPAKIYKDRVEVEIPALQNIVKKRISETDELSCVLAIDGEGFHLEPWKSSMNIQRSAYIDTGSPIVEDVNDSLTMQIIEESEDIRKNKKHLLDEDIHYLNKLKNQLNIKNDNTKENVILSENKKEKPVKTKKIKRFNKKAFIQEITKIEEKAVINNIPLSETGKNDNEEQLKLRKKVRKIFQEALERKLKEKQIKKASEEKIITESNQNNFDVTKIKEDEINQKTIISLMESVGMTSEKTHIRMMNHAKDKGAKTDVEIFDTIKNMLYPQHQPNSLHENYQQNLEFFANREEK